MHKNSGVFISKFLVLIIARNVKLTEWKTSEIYILRVFRELQVSELTSHFGSDFPLRLARCMSDTRLNIFRFLGLSENETNLQYENYD